MHLYGPDSFAPSFRLEHSGVLNVHFAHASGLTAERVRQLVSDKSSDRPCVCVRHKFSNGEMLTMCLENQAAITLTAHTSGNCLATSL